MLIFKKEKKARKLALKHFAKTHECLMASLEVVECYVGGDNEAAQLSAERVIALEKESDDLKRAAREVLFSGAFLPHIRSDVYRLIEAVDTVADKAETASNFVVNQAPRIPDEFQVRLVEIFEVCISCYHELREALKSFFEPKGEIKSLHDRVSRVGALETEVDTMQAELTREIFSSPMDKAEKLHLCQLLRHIARIADSAEDASDDLEYAAMKSVV